MKPKTPRSQSYPDKLLRDGVFLPAYIVGAVGAATVMTYISQFHQTLKFPLSDNPAVWGAFGDYIGGVLNPLCAYMAFIWLVRSYALQKTELSETRKSLEESLKAQQEQARLSLVSAKTQSLSIRLTALGANLASLRSSQSRVLEHLDLKGEKHPIRGDDGVMMDPIPALTALYIAIQRTVSAQHGVMEALDAIAASHEPKI